jgi:hypothetical protein
MVTGDRPHAAGALAVGGGRELPPSWKRAVWGLYDLMSSSPWLVWPTAMVSASGFTLLGNDTKSLIATFFEGERGGCD